MDDLLRVIDILERNDRILDSLTFRMRQIQHTQAELQAAIEELASLASATGPASTAAMSEV